MPADWFIDQKFNCHGRINLKRIRNKVFTSMHRQNNSTDRLFIKKRESFS